MILIICIDENGGMAFNNRRQTRDIVQRRHLNRKLNGKFLWMSPYTQKLFEPDLPDVACRVFEDYYPEISLALKDKEQYLLSELEFFEDMLDSAEKVMIYKWNRSYPDDVVFPLERLREFQLEELEEFAGSSHDKISYELYERRYQSREMLLKR